MLSIEKLCIWLNNYPTWVPLIKYFDSLKSRRSKYLPPKKEINLRMFYYRLIDRASDFIDVAKIDGLLWGRLNPFGFDLISDLAKFKLTNFETNNLPKKCSDFRRSAVKNVLNLISFNKESRNQNKRFFTAYLEDIADKYICMIRYEPKITPIPALVVPYKTRFNSTKSVKKTLDLFDNLINTATESYSNAVFLTLTTDPKLFENVWEANRHFSIALNKFFSYLQKHCGHRYPYISVYEYTKRTGLMHAHILFFDTNWLAKHTSITKEWQRCGQGMINYEYTVHNWFGEWQWTRKKPKNNRGRSVVDYLKKYLKKALYDSADQDLFWLFNKRYLTYSRRLLFPAVNSMKKVIFWKYIGTYRLFDVPDIFFINAKGIPWYEGG